MNIRPISAFSDNYIWCLDDGQSAWVVDPGDAAPVEAALAEWQLTLVGILLTHHHFDHVGGVAQLAEARTLRIVGPDGTAPQINETVSGGDHVSLLGETFVVMEVPGHTLDHIAYHCCSSDTAPALFAGDTLFAGGCGRLFEGTPQQMLQSLQSLRALPGDTRVYCAHEYTTANLGFAAAVEPENPQLQQRIADTAALRAKNIPTVPSELALEQATNPFLRWDVAQVRAAAEACANIDGSSAVDVFAAIRKWKDDF